ncbi:hypothetical protein [Microbacterium sp. NPDC089188]|uniref:hypothetical protein n=1 Tax=Microbacterium sp. NPDC089188 TaxID=3154971 RepID=UPI00344077EF
MDELQALLHTRAELLDRDVPTARLRAGNEGDWHRVQRGVYVPRDAVRELWPQADLRLRIVASLSRMRGGNAVVSHASAAVVHGLSLSGIAHRPVEMTVAGGGRMSSRPGLKRHLDELTPDDVVEVDGIRCTSLERTVFDVARTAPLETGVSCADAAARRVAVQGRTLLADAQEGWRDRLRLRAAAAAGHRGVARARWVIEFMDGRAESPGESLSRLQLFRLGFRSFELQMAVEGPTGEPYEIDIGLPDEKILWEFDGEGKYTDAALRSGRSLEDILLREKRREEWIRGVTQWRFLRGGFRDVTTPEALATRLAAFGVPLPNSRDHTRSSR